MNLSNLQLRLKKISFFIVVIMFMHSCKSRHVKKVAMLPETVVVQDSSNVHASQTEQLYRVVVSFISIGEGTDQEARSILDNYISTFRGTHGVLAKNAQLPWGREGEVDNCFLLDDFSPDQELQFINGLKELFKENKLVHIDENQRKTFTR